MAPERPALHDWVSAALLTMVGLAAATNVARGTFPDWLRAKFLLDRPPAPAAALATIPTNIGTPDLTSPGQPIRGGVAFPREVERWRPLVAKYWPPQLVNQALSVMQCESGGDPTAVNKLSHTSGLFQQQPRYWVERSTAAGFAARSIFDPEANIAASAWLYASRSRPWQDWSCKPSPGL